MKFEYRDENFDDARSLISSLINFIPTLGLNIQIVKDLLVCVAIL